MKKKKNIFFNNKNKEIFQHFLKHLNQKSSLNFWLDYFGDEHQKFVNMSLKQIFLVAQNLDLLCLNAKVITISGTNGKGTTSCIVESILIEAGFKVGVYSSPELLCYTERVRIQGKMLPEEEFCRVFSKIELNRKGNHLTYFEYSTLAALQLFKEKNLDVIILEVGLGGRLDATNIINSDIAAITNIALDHIEKLGDNRNQIGFEKSGIFRPNKYAICGDPNIPKSVIKFSKNISAKTFFRDKDWNFNKTKINSWEWHSKKLILKDLPIPKTLLDNAAVALAIIFCLSKDSLFSKLISFKIISNGLLKAYLPGRFQIVSHDPCIILDVAHNPNAAMYLANQLSELPKSKNSRIHALIGMLIDKDIRGTINPLLSQIDIWYLVSLNTKRGAKAKDLSTYIKYSFQFDSVKKALDVIKKNIQKNDILLIYGSFHTVSDFIKTAYNR